MIMSCICFINETATMTPNHWSHWANGINDVSTWVNGIAIDTLCLSNPIDWAVVRKSEILHCSTKKRDERWCLFSILSLSFCIALYIMMFYSNTTLFHFTEFSDECVMPLPFLSVGNNASANCSNLSDFERINLLIQLLFLLPYLA